METSAKPGGTDVDRIFHKAIRLVLAKDQEGSNGQVAGRPDSSIFTCFTSYCRFTTFINSDRMQ